MSEPILKLEGLKKHFNTTTGGAFNKQKAILKAVDGIDLEVAPGETIGLVGESGCGKTTAGRTILKLYEPTDGKIIFEGEDISKISDVYHTWRGESKTKYEDVAGFCKSASLDEIRKYEYILTPGRYVGAEEEDVDPEEFKENNQTSLSLIFAASTAIFSFVVGMSILKSASSNVPCLNIKKKPVLALPGPVPSFR